MIKIPLNSTELHSLIELLMFANYSNIEDIYMRELVGDQIRRLLRRLDNRLMGFPATKNESKIGFKPADLAAMYKALKCYNNCHEDFYNENLALKIKMMIEQKTA